MAEAIDAVTVSFVPADAGGYIIQGDSGAAGVLEKGQQFLSKHSEPIQRAIDEFGDFTARMLELYTTTIFVARDLGESIGPSRERVFEAVMNLKPYFIDSEIDEAIEDLVDKGLIDLKD